MLEGGLLPGRGVRNLIHAERQLGIGPSSKQIYEREIEHLTDRVEHPGKKIPLRGKDLVWVTELVH